MLKEKSLATKILELPKNEQDDFFNNLTEQEAHDLIYSWNFWARPSQMEPDWKWRIWLVLAGRGFGKTRTGAEWVKKQIYEGKAKRIALVAPTAADGRDIMVEGESGILSVFPDDERPYYEPSKRRITFPNGAVAITYSADKPDRLRGPQHDAAWCDEVASWRYSEAWDMLMLGLRLGRNPRAIVTTTPKPVPLIKGLVKDKRVHVTKGNTYENKQNLSEDYIEEIVSKYEGTTLGQQEIYADIIDDNPNALWDIQMIEENRVNIAPELQRIVVAIDPAVTSEKESAETGIVIAGLADNGHAYVLEDISVKAKPDEWGRIAVKGYYDFEADRIIGEANNGGDLIETVIRTIDELVSYKKVYATKGKKTRAEPISALYEQGKVHHVGMLAQLESQMVSWIPGEKSPDRMDALVWALTELMLGKRKKKVNMKNAGGLSKYSRWNV